MSELAPLLISFSEAGKRKAEEEPKHVHFEEAKEAAAAPPTKLAKKITAKKAAKAPSPVSRRVTRRR